MNYRTYSDLSRDIKNFLPQIVDVDLIVGIPRSGMVPAYMIGAFLNRYVCTLEDFISGNELSKGSRSVRERDIKKVLIIDDSVNEGLAMAKAREKLKGVSEKYQLVFAAVYASDQGRKLVDLYADYCPQPRVFQWNYLYHPGVLQSSCLDIDGVLCIDPTEEENDDGEKYRHFILNAKPLYLPNYKVKALVTSRLEKYRPETETWLRENGVEYDRLYMLDLPSKEERIRLGAHAPFKAEIYKKVKDSWLFIESNPNQARQIFDLTGKMTICTETDELFYFGMPVEQNGRNAQKKVTAKKKCGKFKIGLIKVLCWFVPFRVWRRRLRSIYK